jgi:S-DNA-T family DNA segregation ATPase FtsK/SpoIIIE
MASYQTRQREPLLDQDTAAMLERRGRELVGIGLLIMALLFVMMLGSYSVTDPGWMVATDEPAANMLGRFGAALSSTMIIIGGKGVWSIPAILLAWGLRFVTHRGADRVVQRAIFAVIAVAISCLYATTLHPSDAWVQAHGFGLGGLFGETFMGTLLGIMPTSASFAIKFLSLTTGVMLLASMAFVMGFDRGELTRLRRFLFGGMVGSYASVLGAGATSVASARGYMHERRTAPHVAERDMRGRQMMPDERRYGAPESPLSTPPMFAMRPEPTLRPEPAVMRADPQPTEGKGLFGRLANPISRNYTPEPELIEQIPSFDDIDAPDDDRLKSRITDAVRHRAANPLPRKPEPPLTRRPLIADTRPAQPNVMPKMAPVMPPVTSDFGRDPLDHDGYDGNWIPDHLYEADDGGFEVPDYAPTPAPRMAPMSEERRSVVQPTAKKPIAPSRQALAESQPRMRFEEVAPRYELPPLSLLANPSTVQRYTLSHEALEENARMLESVLDDYGVKGEIVSVRPGPVVTMYELEPAPGLKASRVIGLSDDIARSMSALSARVSTVPGRTVIGIELPNATREKVVLREIISARDFGDSAMRLPLALGKDIGGEPIIANLAKMPHLLIAGTTGSGKSVAINTMILSLLYKLSPEECRLIMIDPKMLELSVYDGIPHLLSPVVTDPKKAVVALKWVVSEMEERYRKMSKMGVRNIEGYNGRVREALEKNEMFRRTIQTGFDEDTGEPMFETEEFQPVTIPYIVVVVDEMADLMMVAGKEIEACIQRLAQMARASGIHLIMATQRPSVDVITGTIKANFPTRISFQVTSKIDSRTILGEQGAEQLLGMGDMLFMAGGGRINRIHGPFVSDEEVEEIVNHLKSYGPPKYMSGVVDEAEDAGDEVAAMLGEGGDDSLYDQAVAIVAKDRKCSTSYIQRKLGIGYNKAARLVEQMEENLVVTTANHVGKREILLPEH